MKFIKTLIILLIISVSVGFIYYTESVVGNTDESPFEMMEVKNLPVENGPMIEIVDKGAMVASWYGPKFHGKLTANGEIYNQMALTAAHKTLPFGTMLRLTNPKNGAETIIRINDRGPYIEGRNIDLSKGAAIALGVLKKGVVRLQVEQLVVKNMTSPIL